MSYLADALKEKGNTAFREGNYNEAEDFYTQVSVCDSSRLDVRTRQQSRDCISRQRMGQPRKLPEKGFPILGHDIHI